LLAAVPVGRRDGLIPQKLPPNVAGLRNGFMTGYRFRARFPGAPLGLRKMPQRGTAPALLTQPDALELMQRPRAIRVFAVNHKDRLKGELYRLLSDS
jgi:hypothetical protein